MACDKNIRVKHYVGEKFKQRENSKLRPVIEKLRNHSQIITVNERPVALKWDHEHNLTNNEGSITCAACDVCDVCDETDNTISSNKNYNNNNYSNTSDSESGSHISHSSHSNDSPTEESSTHTCPRNSGHINRIAPHSDIWVCNDCTLRGDKWFMLEHNCKGLKN
jgi:hypothetical protein